MTRTRWAAAALILACARDDVARADSAITDTIAGIRPGVRQTAATRAQGGPLSFPAVGIAVRDTAGRWCAAFAPDSAGPLAGDVVALVFATRETSATWYARRARAREAQCHSEFPQPRWEGYRFFDLTLTDSSAGPADPRGVALAVASPVTWGQLGDGRVVADLDGEGPLEEARRCAADEGEHFTIWSFATDGSRRRRAHEYYDWGALVTRTCRPGDDGMDGEPAP